MQHLPQNLGPDRSKPCKNEDGVAKKVTKAVSGIVLDDPFYGYLLLRQTVRADYGIGTACTDGVEIRYNPNFVDDLSLPQLKGLLKHEVMHIAHLHHLRRQNREPRKWNMAADYVINAHLLDAGEELPDNGLFDPSFKEHSTEHAYAILPEDPPGNGPFGDDQWDWGGVVDHPDGQGASEAERHQLEEDAKLDVVQAANTAKVMGKMPAGVEALVDKIRESKMPWRRLLARFFSQATKDQENWSRPNRRWLAHNIYFPSLHNETLGPIVIGVDTSGSVSTPELEAFFGCVSSILRHARPEKIHVVYCDAKVGSVQEFTTNQLPLRPGDFKIVGRGGTRFEPVFEYVAEKRIKPAVLLYMTDMCASFDFDRPKYPVIWCATSKHKAPWGKTVEIEA